MIPIGTDAPVYHRPWATIGLIATNVAVFVHTGAGFGVHAEGWILFFGQGLHPISWLTHNFLHFGLGHLIGNMVFLWIFGLIIEGKLGWWRFLTVYLMIGVLGGFSVQLGMLGAGPESPGAGGASLCVFGLLAMALVWAPMNEINCVGFFLFHPFWWDIPIYLMAIFYIGINLLLAGLTKFSMGSAVLHLVGTGLGFGIAVVMLRRRWVDCENWDLFTILAGRRGRSSRHQPYRHRTPRRPKVRRSQMSERPAPSRSFSEPLKLSTVSLSEIQDAIADNDVAKACTDYAELKSVDPAVQLPEPDLWRLATGLCKLKPTQLCRQGRRRSTARDQSQVAQTVAHINQWHEAILMLREYLDRFPDGPHATAAQMQLASILLATRRPTEARQLLASVEKGQLPNKWKQAYAGMYRRAQRQSRKESASS